MLFVPYWRLVIGSLVAAVMAAVLSLLPAFTAADIIDRAIPTAQFPRISLDIFILLMAACIGVDGGQKARVFGGEGPIGSGVRP